MASERVRTFAETHFSFGPCYHSMMKPNCAGCLQGHAARLEHQLQKLEVSIALPIKESVEAIVLEAVGNWYESWKRVALDTKDWVKNAAHSLSWDINRALPMTDATNSTGAEG